MTSVLIIFRQSVPMTKYLYHQLEQQLRLKISSGQLAAQSKLPSIRVMCLEANVSKSTVITAYSRLEAAGLIEARSKSGYYVCAKDNRSEHQLKSPATSNPASAPKLISRTQVMLDLMKRGAAFDLLSSSHPDPHNTFLRRCLSKALRNQSGHEQHYYDQPQGDEFLRIQLAKVINQGGGNISCDQVIVSNGCQHSLLMALMVATQPNDVVAIESPGFYGALQLLEVLGRKVLEIPSSVVDGISPDALRLAADHWQIKALIVSPSYATPTGACMPSKNKQQILQLAEQHQFCIIEDDIYAGLHFTSQRPSTIYSYDKTGSVILCSSFSKSLSRDLRIGWIVSKKYHQQILALKVATSMASGISQQQGVASFIAQGGLDKHLKLRRQQLALQRDQMLYLIQQHLPMVQSISRPTGGMVAWVELESNINTLHLYHQAKERGLTITPGSLFGAQDTYQHYLRLSFAHPWTAPRIEACKVLATLISKH